MAINDNAEWKNRTEDDMNGCVADLSNKLYAYGTRHTPEMIRDLSLRAYEYRIQVLRMVYGRKSGHIGGAFSIAEVLTALYFHQLRLDPDNPGWDGRDRLRFFKSDSCRILLYVVVPPRQFPP